MKLNPNDVCWCGSGRKYKKCHMMQDDKMQILRDRRLLVPDQKLFLVLLLLNVHKVEV